jgi:hypothetical protein
MAPIRNMTSNNLPNTRNSGRLASNDVSPCELNCDAMVVTMVELVPMASPTSMSGIDGGIKDRSWMRSEMVYVDYAEVESAGTTLSRRE